MIGTLLRDAHCSHFENLCQPVDGGFVRNVAGEADVIAVCPYVRAFTNLPYPDRIELRNDRSTVQKNDAPYQLLNFMLLFNRLLLYRLEGLVATEVDP